MMEMPTPHLRLRLVTLAFLVLGVLMMAQVSMAQQGTEDYKVSILKRNSVAVGGQRGDGGARRYTAGPARPWYPRAVSA